VEVKQRLAYEASWEKGISSNDRQLIENIFQGINSSQSGIITFSPVRAVYNYRGDLLATALVNNYTSKSLTFRNAHLYYIENGNEFADYIFTLPQLLVLPSTSMPWTFIFPVTSVKKEPSLDNWLLSI
jgi:SLAP domain-containing protein